MERKWRLVVVGNGMAGINTVEQLLKLTDRYDITVIGRNRIPTTTGFYCLTCWRAARSWMISY